MTDDERRPPDIVEAADSPQRALAAFIGQELEQWGFVIEPFTIASNIIVVRANNKTLEVRVL